MTPLSPGADAQLESVRKFGACMPQEGDSPFSACYRKLILEAYRRLIPPSARVLEIGCGSGELLAGLPNASRTGIDLSPERVEAGLRRHPGLDLRTGCAETADLPGGPFDVILLSDVLNEVADAELLLRNLHRCSHPGTRLILNVHNTLWRPILSLARAAGLARPQLPQSWLSTGDVANLCRLSDWEVFGQEGRILLPAPLGPIARLVNRWIAPLASPLCLALFLTARPTGRRPAPSRISVVVPARNEAGNIAAVLERMPDLGAETELIFVEGHSRDATWEAIAALPDRHARGTVVKLRQKGEGKHDAVLEGFRAATGDLLLILDADLSTPPEDLPKFVRALTEGKGEFANGVRLVYPMEGKAMQFLNLCANKAFGLIFSWLLGQPLKDTLCGTKALWIEDYRSIESRRAEFGDFDPFGDFELLFGASRNSLRIVDVPVRYSERTYGATNISRWKHGVMLVRAMLVAARKIKFT